LGFLKGIGPMKSAHQFCIRAIPRSFEEGERTVWLYRMFFTASTPIMEKYQAVVFLASENAISHLVHGHPEEEVVIPLSGGLELFKQNDDLKHGRNGLPFLPGNLLYLPAYDPHSFRGKGPGHSIILALKWKGNLRGSEDEVLKTSVFNIPENPSPSQHGPPKVSRALLFGGPTRYAVNLRAHISRIEAGAGYEAQTPSHDLMMLLLEGRLDIMHIQVPSPALLFFPAGTSYWARNTGQSPASLLTFEFHTLLQ
jgi:hypothetical protein